MLNNKSKIAAAIFVLIFSLVNSAGVCRSEVVNSIVARVNDHIITLTDLEVEHHIRKRLEKAEDISTDALINDMIDDYLIMSEVRKAPQKKLKKEQEANISAGIKLLEDSFAEGGYLRFLSEYGISEDDIYKRFKNEELIKGHLTQNIRIKKKVSNMSENVLLNKDYTDLSVEDIEAYVNKLRTSAYLIMINKIVAD